MGAKISGKKKMKTPPTIYISKSMYKTITIHNLILFIHKLKGTLTILLCLRIEDHHSSQMILPIKSKSMQSNYLTISNIKPRKYSKLI